MQYSLKNRPITAIPIVHLLVKQAIKKKNKTKNRRSWFILVNAISQKHQHIRAIVSYISELQMTTYLKEYSSHTCVLYVFITNSELKY